MKEPVYRIISCISILFFASSCVIEDSEHFVDNAQIVYLNAKMEEQPETRARLERQDNGFYYPLWEHSDSLAVFTEQGQCPAAFTLVGGEGTTEGLFKGSRSGTQYVALYPYYANAEFKDNHLLFSLPEKQNGGFPMIAVSDDGNLQFKNLCSIIKLSLTGSCVVGSITIHSDKQFLSGPSSVDLSFSDMPQLVMQEGGSHDVSLDCGAVILNPDKAKEFFVIVPPGNYDGLSITINAFTETITKSITHEVILNRSRLRSVTPFMVEAPMIDMDNLPDNQIWYKTQSGELFSPDTWWRENPPFDANILSNSYGEGFGVIALDSPVKSINAYAFAPDYIPSADVVELYLPDLVKSIGGYALPAGIESFRIPGSIEAIGVGNIDEYGGRRLQKIYGPLVASDERSIVNDGMLLGALLTGLEEYATPPEVKYLKSNSLCLAFTSIKKLILSEGVVSIERDLIGNDVAGYSPSLEEIYLPESLQSIGIEIVSDAPVLKGYFGNKACTSEDNMCLIDPRRSELISIVPGGTNELFYIPEGVTTVSASINNWKNLTTVVVPSSLESFSGSVPLFINCPNIEGFSGCGATPDGKCLLLGNALALAHTEGMNEFTTPSGVLSLSSACFRYSSVDKLIISEGTQFLSELCFINSNIRTIVLPTTIKVIEDHILQRNNVIESVYLPCRVPPDVFGGPSEEQLPGLKVYVPEESIEDYLADSHWANWWGQYLTPYHFDNIDAPAPYISTDYSQDGKVTVLQTATEGRGIDIVFMGSSFSDRMIADGTYLSTMEDAMEAFFEPEPYRSFRQLFNVYAVNIVSEREDTGPDNRMQYVFLTSHSDECLEYTQKAIPDDRLDEATAIMICRTKFQLNGGYGLASTFGRTSTPQTDYGSGLGVALLTSSSMGTLVRHEAGGHAFGKLADEYDTSNGGRPSESEIENSKALHREGKNMNKDYTSDPKMVVWAKFLDDSRYKDENLGIYEISAGTGRYRPSRQSIMSDSRGFFNAPSREAIYYRIHKLAYGPEWEYNYEDFVKWDQGAKNIHPTATPQSVSGKKTYEVREPLPSKPFNPDEWTVTVMK